MSGNDQGAGGGTETTGPDCRGQEEVRDRGKVSSADIFNQKTAVKDLISSFYFQGGGRSEGSGRTVTSGAVPSP